MQTPVKFVDERHNAAAGKNRLTRGQAEEIAILALRHLGEDHDRLSRFLSLTGLEADNLRSAASQPGFLLALLDYFAGCEPDLLAFATTTKIAPESIAQARILLGGTRMDS